VFCFVFKLSLVCFLSSVVMLACDFRALCFLGDLTHCFDDIDTQNNDIFVFWHLGLNSVPTHSATAPALFLWWVFFWDRVLRSICLGWLWTMILLISASQWARITGASCWRLACSSSLYIWILLLFN
jgi:hypothetical protein